MAGTTANDTPIQSENIFGQPLSIFGVPVDRDTIFHNHKGVYNKGIEKRQRRLIVKSTFIKFYLHNAELIRCITTGFSPISVLEQALTGPAFLFFKRALFIFTDKRILHIPTRFDRSPRSAISQILYEDCARIYIKGRALHVEYKNGQKDVFPYLGRKEKKKIRALIAQIPLSPKDAGRLEGRVNLCPSCANVLKAGTKTCDACKIVFKTSFQAKLRTLLIPGGGYFYAQYPVVGTCAGLFDVFIVAYIAYSISRYHNGYPINALIFFLLVAGLIFTKIAESYHTAQLIKDFVPAEKDYAVRKV